MNFKNLFNRSSKVIRKSPWQEKLDELDAIMPAINQVNKHNKYCVKGIGSQIIHIKYEDV